MRMRPIIAPGCSMQIDLPKEKHRNLLGNPAQLRSFLWDGLKWRKPRECDRDTLKLRDPVQLGGPGAVGANDRCTHARCNNIEISKELPEENIQTNRLRLTLCFFSSFLPCGGPRAVCRYGRVPSRAEREPGASPAGAAAKAPASRAVSSAFVLVDAGGPALGHASPRMGDTRQANPAGFSNTAAL